jgi:hypothetical protein
MTVNERLYVLAWTDKRSRLQSGETEPGIRYYDGRSGIPCSLLDARQYKTRQGAERARNSLPLEVVEFELVESKVGPAGGK